MPFLIFNLKSGLVFVWSIVCACALEFPCRGARRCCKLPRREGRQAGAIFESRSVEAETFGAFASLELMQLQIMRELFKGFVSASERVNLL